MPLLDFMPALLNPMTVDEFAVQRRYETVNDFGEASSTLQVFAPVYGTVTAGDYNTLDRRDDSQLQPNTISVVTQFLLTGPAPGKQPDIIVWPANNGTAYLVTKVEDYSRYGAGWIQAKADAMQLVNPSPQQQIAGPVQAVGSMDFSTGVNSDMTAVL